MLILLTVNNEILLILLNQGYRDYNGTQTHNYLVRNEHQPFSQTGQVTELCFEYLSVWCI